MTSQEKVNAVTAILEDMKSETIETIDVRNKTSVADYFVICTGTSDRHVDAISDRVLERMRDQKVKPLRKEGAGTGWILLDYGDVIVNVMLEEQRQFYDLETLWKSMRPHADLPEGSEAQS